MGSCDEDIKMSAGEEATIGFSFGGEVPAQERQGPPTATVSQARIEAMDVEDELVLTNKEKFFPELVNF